MWDGAKRSKGEQKLGSRQHADLLLNSAEPEIVLREAGPQDLARTGLTDQYFVSAEKGLGRDLEICTFKAVVERCQATPDTLRLWAEDSNGFGILLVEHKPWDSSLLGVPTRNLLIATAAADRRHRTQIASHLLHAFLSRYCERQYVVTRIPCEDVALLHALQENRFKVIVPMVTLGCDYSESSDVPLPSGVEISAVRACELDAVSSISARAFQWGRFSADPGVPEESAANVHALWARNCAIGTHAAQTLVARTTDGVVGFIALKFLSVGSQEIGSIELIAISPRARGLGIGRALVRSGCNCITQSTPHIVVRTELPNTAALRMYEAEGFRILNGSLYLTLWQERDEGAAR